MTNKERELAIDIFEDNFTVIDTHGHYTEEEECLAIDMSIQALEQEPNIGHWISHREHCEMNNLRPSGLGSYFWCSNCDCGIDVREWHRNNYNYCPNCGARMESEE